MNLGMAVLQFCGRPVKRYPPRREEGAERRLTAAITARSFRRDAALSNPHDHARIPGQYLRNSSTEKEFSRDFTPKAAASTAVGRSASGTAAVTLDSLVSHGGATLFNSAKDF